MRKVKAAYLHSTLSFPGISTDLGTSLNPYDIHSKIKGAELNWAGDGLELKYKGKVGFIPFTNVKLVEFFPETAEPKLVS